MAEEAPPDLEPADDTWMWINMRVPADEGAAWLEVFRRVGWKGTDFCEMTHKRIPGALIDFAPTWDPRNPQEGD